VVNVVIAVSVSFLGLLRRRGTAAFNVVGRIFNAVGAEFNVVVNIFNVIAVATGDTAGLPKKRKAGVLINVLAFV